MSHPKGSVQSADEPPRVECRDLRFGYDQTMVLHDVSLAVAAGEIVGIIGPNGSGKTTLLRLLAGLRRPKAGVVRLDGQPVETLSDRCRARRIALVAQSPTMAFSFSVLQVVLLGRLPHGSAWLERSADLAAAHEALSAVGASHLADRTVDTLSGGERQRVFIARALAQAEGALLLDEPTNHLDPAHQMSVWDRLVDRVRAASVAVVAVIHQLNLAAQFCDRLVVLDGGRVVGDGSPGQIIDDGVLQAVYGIRLQVGPHPDRPVRYVATLRR